MLTLVCLRVQTLQQCLARISASGLRDADELVHLTLWKLRQYLRAVAAGVPGFQRDSCPALDADACFDTDDLHAQAFGLKKTVRLSHIFGGPVCMLCGCQATRSRLVLPQPCCPLLMRLSCLTTIAPNLYAG